MTAGVFGLAWVGQAAAVPTPVASTILLITEADAGSGRVIDETVDTQGATLNPLAGAVSATAVSGAASVTSHASGAATWVNPAQGQVLLSDIGWETVNVGTGFAGHFAAAVWSYTFVPDPASTFFTMDWSISASGTNTFGLAGFRFSFNGQGDQFLPLDTSGRLNRAILPGTNFAELLSISNISGGLGTRTADMDGTFNFSITTLAAVPEPPALFILSMGIIGIALVKHVV